MRECDLRFALKNNPDQLSLLEQQKIENPRLSDHEAVRAICERLLAESGVAPPVNVGLLASMRGIVRVEEREQDYAGMLVHQPGGMVAHVRREDSLTRKRFTVLHEAGHTLLPGYAEARRYRCKGPRSLEEQLCDFAAGELMFPREVFAADLADAGFGTAATVSLAARYEAGLEATALRSVEEWPDDAALLVLRVAHKPAEAGREAEVPPRLRLRWSYSKGEWPYIRPHKSVADDSAFGRAHVGELVEELGAVGELAAGDPGPVWISARRYRRDGSVLAMLTKRAGVRTRAVRRG